MYPAPRPQVYNMTLYVPFHPGGKAMIMSGAGRDCTALFQKYHRWVSGDMMLQRCLVGKLELPGDAQPPESGVQGLACTALVSPGVRDCLPSAAAESPWWAARCANFL